jgi:uncharacterized protein with ParB-like and HNH nuclease domain
MTENTKKNFIESLIFGNSGDNGNWSFDIQPKNIYQFLTSGQPFKKIPEYQRPYSWQESHVIKFLDDILNVTKKKEGKDSWFLGSIYVTRSSIEDKYSSVLDGQQRLTTLQVILNELRLAKYYDDSIEFSDEISENLDEIKFCLVYNEGDGDVKKPRFRADNITNDFFEDYIIKSLKVNSYDKYMAFIKNWHENEDTGTGKSLSIKTLYNNIKIIKKFIKDNLLYVSINDNDEKFDLLNIEDKIASFIKTLLYRVWLIEIPLKSESISIEIFDSLNNRGKPLSLVDKIQFFSLSKWNLNIPMSNQIKFQWSEIYVLIDKHTRYEKGRIFQSEEDLIRSFFLGTRGIEISNDDEFLDLFKNSYLISEFKTLEFFSKLKSIINFFNGLEKLDDFILLNNFEKHEKDKKEMAKAILIVLRIFVKQYKNTVYLIINLLSKFNYENKDERWNLLQGIWSILRLAYYKNIFEGESPNLVRSSFNSIIRNHLNSDPSIYSRLIFHLYSHGNKVDNDIYPKELDSFETYNLEIENFEGKLRNLVKTNNGKLIYKFNKSLDSSSLFLNTVDNNKAKLILYLYVLLTKYSSITTFAKDKHDNMNLEHIFPRSWKSNWENKRYSKSDVLEYLSKKGFNTLHNMVDNFSGDFELLLEDGKPVRQPESLIEWIGNKLILDDGRNKTGYNYNFKTKFVNVFSPNGAILLPDINSDENLRLDENTDFDYKIIIDRSIHIIDTVSNNFFSVEWDMIPKK